MSSSRKERTSGKRVGGAGVVLENEQRRTRGDRGAGGGQNSGILGKRTF